MKENKFLPIGTIVKVKDSKELFMITSYCVFPTGTELKSSKEIAPKRKMYEYGGCFYPQGILSSDIALAWNHGDITEVVHKGYVNDDYNEFNEILNKNYDQAKKVFETGNAE